MSKHNSLVRTHQVYVNSGPLHSTIVDSNNLPVSWVADSTITSLLSKPGRVAFKDMGTYIPDPNPNEPYSSILRKIKLIRSGLSQPGVSTNADLYTGYIRMGVQPSTMTCFFPSTISRLI